MFILHFFVATLLQKWHFSMKSTEKSLMGGQFCKIYPPMRHASSSSPPEWIWEKLTLYTVKNDSEVIDKIETRGSPIKKSTMDSDKSKKNNDQLGKNIKTDQSKKKPLETGWEIETDF